MFENETKAEFLNRAWAKAFHAMSAVSDGSAKYSITTRGLGDGFLVEVSERPESQQEERRKRKNARESTHFSKSYSQNNLYKKMTTK